MLDIPSNDPKRIREARRIEAMCDESVCPTDAGSA